MPDAPDAPVVSGTAVGRLSAAISNAVVRSLHDYTGRGPTHARTTIGPDTIVVTLRDSLTKAERTLAQSGQEVEVLAMRRAFQNTMRDDMIAAVENSPGVVSRRFSATTSMNPMSLSRSSSCTPATPRPIPPRLSRPVSGCRSCSCGW